MLKGTDGAMSVEESLFSFESNKKSCSCQYVLRLQPRTMEKSSSWVKLIHRISLGRQCVLSREAEAELEKNKSQMWLSWPTTWIPCWWPELVKCKELSPGWICPMVRISTLQSEGLIPNSSWGAWRRQPIDVSSHVDVSFPRLNSFPSTLSEN